VEALRRATRWLLTEAGGPRDVAAGAAPYLRLFGTVVGGWVLGRQALVARGAGGDGARVATARYYLVEVLPTATALEHAVAAGADVLATALADVLGTAADAR
jgi:hypothetical protein